MRRGHRSCAAATARLDRGPCMYTMIEAAGLLTAVLLLLGKFLLSKKFVRHPDPQASLCALLLDPTNADTAAGRVSVLLVALLLLVERESIQIGHQLLWVCHASFSSPLIRVIRLLCLRGPVRLQGCLLQLPFVCPPCMTIAATL